ncbi:MAG: signal peptidase II [Candidatus Sumerlaeia bacterium]
MKLFQPFDTTTDPARPVSRVTFLVLAAATLILDQISKLVVVSTLNFLDPVVVIPNFLQLQYTHNTGAAFSIASEHTMLLALFSLIISIVLVYIAWTRTPEEQGMRIGLGLILGGAVGNLIDRFRLGYVIDFIDAHWFYKAHWPIFNIADSAICIGIGLWLIASFRLKPTEKPAKSK